MKFVSLRNKLNNLTTTILIGSIGAFFILTIILGMVATQKILKASYESIRNGLIAKGKLLVSNNSYALRGMAEDNSFLAIRELITSNVENDNDIIYGIFMDQSCRPWVKVDFENPSGIITIGSKLNDTVSLWAHSLKKQMFKEIVDNNSHIIEFAAPVESDSIRLGTIRYGISTSSMSGGSFWPTGGDPQGQYRGVARHHWVSMRSAGEPGTAVLLSAVCLDDVTEGCGRIGESKLMTGLEQPSGDNSRAG